VVVERAAVPQVSRYNNRLHPPPPQPPQPPNSPTPICRGSVLWTYKTGGAIFSSPALSDTGLLYFGSHDFDVHCVNATTGAGVWVYPAGFAEIHSSPSLSPDGGALFVGSYSGAVLALDALTGALRWSFMTGGAVEASPALSVDATLLYVGCAAAVVRRARSQLQSTDAYESLPPPPPPMQERRLGRLCSADVNRGARVELHDRRVCRGVGSGHG
jgi:hypothetical protein